MNDRKRFLSLLLINTVVALVGVSISNYILYQTAFEEERERLVETVQSQARLIEAIARFDSVYSEDHLQDPYLATMSQIIDAHKNYKGFGKTGEFTLAKLEDDSIVFLLSHRHHDLNRPQPVPFFSEKAQPMQRALSGKSGTIVGLDYRGEKVLAAYEPVAMLYLGLVAKIDLSEIRAPFIRASLIAFMSAVMIVLIGSLLFLRIGNPVLLRLQEYSMRLEGLVNERTAELTTANKQLRVEFTERKHAEERLRISEEKTEAILQTVGEGIITIDAFSRIRFVNRELGRIFGYSRDELAGQSLLIIIPEKYRDAHVAGVKRYLDGGQPKILGRRLELEGLRKDGSVFPVELKVYETKLEKATGRFFTAAIRDITKQKRMQDALREQEERFRKIFEEGQLGMVIVGADRQFLRINATMCHMLGYTEQELTALTWSDITHPDDIKVGTENAEKLVRGEIPYYKAEKRYLKKSGEILWVSLTVSVIHKENGSIMYFFSMIEEITERKQAEEHILKYQKQLQSLASELSLAEERERKRIATELHDRIAQSLAFSKIKLSVLREKVSSTEAGHIVEELHETFEQLIQDARSLTFELAPPILYELGLEKAIEWLAEYIQKESGLAVNFKRDEQDKLLTDDVRITLFQAIREALINVVKHAQAKNINVSVEKVGRDIKIQIVDDGRGFDVAQVITPDLRISGFGLFSMRERIKYLGGNCEVNSKPGSGTRITLKAPLAGEKS